MRLFSPRGQGLTPDGRLLEKKGVQDRRSHAGERDHFRGGSKLYGFLGHAKDDAALLVLGQGVGSAFPHFEKTLSPIGSHPSQEHADGV